MRAVVLLVGGEREMEDLAAYLAMLSPKPAEPITGGDVAHGQQLYTVCTACHGPDARGSADLNTPSLAGQDGEYLVRQLENFRSGGRGTNPLDVFGQQMRPIAAATLMSKQDVLDVVAYIGSLSGSGQQTRESATSSAPAPRERARL
jgi:cytochrome c oxidase subunit 2